VEFLSGEKKMSTEAIEAIAIVSGCVIYYSLKNYFKYKTIKDKGYPPQETTTIKFGEGEADGPQD